MRRLAFGCLGFVLFGLATEIVFTGLHVGPAGSFRGVVSLCMVPVYALAYAMGRPLLAALRGAGLGRPAIAIPLTILLIYAIEYAAGSVYAGMGLTPWHYEHGWASDFASGHITLLYLPFWIVFAAILPAVIDRIDRAAAALAAGPVAPTPSKAPLGEVARETGRAAASGS